MTESDHVKEAETYLDLAESGYEGDDAERIYFVGRAQVHATLALVAATEAQAEAVNKAWAAWSERPQPITFTN